MSRVEAVAGMDRLPWLPDEPQPRPAKPRVPIAIWASPAVLLVVGGGFWAGVTSVEHPASAPLRGSPATTTVRLPEPRPAPTQVNMPPQRQVRLSPAPRVRPVPTREARIAAARASHEIKRKAPASARKSARSAAAAEGRAAAVSRGFAPARAVLAKPWNPRLVTGAAGRLVQIGAFGSVRQAKRGWRSMVQDYPAMAHLPGVVRQTRNSKGRTFYRYDVGTTSQAHSEVLCQRMRKVDLSCAVVGLPLKTRVER